jgi:hypothetical protein
MKAWGNGGIAPPFLGTRAPCTKWIGDWMGSRCAVKNRKILQCGNRTRALTKTLIYGNGFKIRMRRNCEHGYSLRTLVSSRPLSRMLKVNIFCDEIRIIPRI